jgi:hypothetical protein
MYEQRDRWIETAFETMRVAAQEEKNLAIRRNRDDANGAPKILVIAHGAWSIAYLLSFLAPIVGYR